MGEHLVGLAAEPGAAAGLLRCDRAAVEDDRALAARDVQALVRGAVVEEARLRRAELPLLQSGRPAAALGDPRGTGADSGDEGEGEEVQHHGGQRATQAEQRPKFRNLEIYKLLLMLEPRHESTSIIE